MGLFKELLHPFKQSACQHHKPLFYPKNLSW